MQQANPQLIKFQEKQYCTHYGKEMKLMNAWKDSVPAVENLQVLLK